MPITSTAVPIDSNSVGDSWIITDEDELARLVGLVLKCEFGHAEAILKNIRTSIIAYTPAEILQINNDIKVSLTLSIDPKTGKEMRDTKKWHRDGVLFEVISWIVARKHSPAEALLRDPHINATTQGLDGLMIELNTAKDDIVSTVVFEDKCTERAESTFSYKTLPALKEHHSKHRKVLESATTLLRQEFKADVLSTLAAKSISLGVRKYRSGLTIKRTEDNTADRQRIFNRYQELSGIGQAARIGCTLTTGIDIRDWFDAFAKKVINSL